MLLLLEKAYKTSTSHDRNPIVQESGPWSYINNAPQFFFVDLLPLHGAQNDTLPLGRV